MPRSFKVLLPARIRTPRPPEGGPGPLLSWVFLRLSRASTERPGPSFPDPALVCFLRLFSRRRATRHSRALLPARIRTRPGRSPGAGRYSLGLCAPLESVPRPPWGRLPVPFPPALPSTALGESGRTALQGLADDQAGRSLAGRPALSRFSTRTCPRLLPTTVFLSVTRPEVSQPARSIFDLHRTRPPEGSRRALLARLPPTARRPPDSTPLEPPRPGRPTAPPVGSVSDDPKTARADPSGREPQAAGHPNPPPGPSPAIRGPPVPSPESVVGDR
jgi:hypothetical protein